MRPTPSLVKTSLDEAICTLAARQVAVRRGAPRLSRTVLEKTAVLKEAGNWLEKLDPMYQKALLGAGVGGTLGLGSSFFQDEEERKPGRSALTGALAGGAAGLGWGLASKYNVLGGVVSPRTAMIGGEQRKLRPEMADRYNKPVSERLEQMEQASKKPLVTIRPDVAAATSGLGLGYKGLQALRSGQAGVRATQSGNIPHLTRATREFVGTNEAVLRAASKPKAVGAPESFKPGGVKGMPDWLKYTRPEVEAPAVGSLHTLAYSSDPARKKALQEFLIHRDVGRLAQETGIPGLAKLAPETINQIMEHGANAEAGLLEGGGNALLRRSRLYRMTGGRVGNPHVNMSTRFGKIRTAGKYGAILAATAALASMGINAYTNRSAAQDYQHAVNRYTTPQ